MINELAKRYPSLEICREDIISATEAIIRCYENKGKLLLCGNGGSAADCEHISGELMKGFLKKRPLSVQKKTEMAKNYSELDDFIFDGLQGGLPTVSLPSLTSFNTAFINDADPRLVYAQAIIALANKEDVLMAISTSGNSENIVCAAKTAYTNRSTAVMIDFFMI